MEWLLPFDFAYGGCVVGMDRVFLCFGSDDYKQCQYTSDIFGSWQNTNSSFTHRDTRVAASESKLFCETKTLSSSFIEEIISQFQGWLESVQHQWRFIDFLICFPRKTFDFWKSNKFTRWGFGRRFFSGRRMEQNWVTWTFNNDLVNTRWLSSWDGVCICCSLRWWKLLCFWWA